MSRSCRIATTAGREIATRGRLPIKVLPWSGTLILVAMSVPPSLCALRAARPTGEVEIRVTDVGTGQPAAVNLFLKNARGRPVTANSNTLRFASTGLYYVDIGNRPRVSRESAQSLLDWVNERAAGLTLADQQQRREVLTYLDRARQFWQQKVQQANAE